MVMAMDAQMRERGGSAMNEHGHAAAETAAGIPAPGYRLPAATRLGPVRLQVADLERSLDYYERVLGLAVRERSRSRASLAALGALEPLVELREHRGATPVPRRGRLGLYHFALLVPERAALGAFVVHLDEVGERFGASDHLVSEALYLHDPDGLGIEVYADRPRAQWRHRDGELVMTTEPLDLAGLVRAAAGSPWGGMPSGTTVGHVHLHVGDLERAAAFYHDALGLDKTVWSYPGALFLSAGGYHHHLGVNTWAAGASAAGENEARLVEWEIQVPSSDDAERALEAMAAADHPVARSGGGGRDGVVRDLWGIALRIRGSV